MKDANISIDDFKEYWTGRRIHKNYNRALDNYFHMSFHFDGYFQRPYPANSGAGANGYTQVNPYFGRLIDERRLAESTTVREYRRRRYKPITQVVCDKVVNSLKKIVKSSDWHIDYTGSDNPKWMPDTDTLEKYCEKDYPFEDSIENWAYTKQIAWLLKDSNSMIVVMPLEWQVPEGEYIKPFAHIIGCRDVFEFRENELCIFKSPFDNEWKDNDGTTQSSPILIAVDRFIYREFMQTGEESFKTIDHPHNLGTMPAIISGGINKSDSVFAPYYESFLRGMLPALDSAAENNSDLVASMIQNLYPTMWYIAGEKCQACQGSGNVLKQGKQSPCPSCDGFGVYDKGPFRDMIINWKKGKLDADSKEMPLPPAGYIEKDLDPIKLLNEYVHADLEAALSAVNMEFLAQVPAKQSGVAKEFDRTEMNNFVYSVAYHEVVNILESVYWFINELRYMGVVPNYDDRQKMLPKISVPEHFDFLIKDGLEDELIKISASSVSPTIKERSELDYIMSKYQDEPETCARLTAEHLHDPLPGMTMTDIQIGVDEGLIPKIDAVLSLNVSMFINQMIEKDNDRKAGTQAFLHMSFVEQSELLYELAQTKLQGMEDAQAAADAKTATLNAEAQQQAIQNAMPNTQGNNDPQPMDTPLKEESTATTNKPNKKERNALDNA